MTTVAYIGGTFDLTHYGHYRLFRAAAMKCDEVVVSVNRDRFVERFKRRPIMELHERMEAVAACRWVTRVVINEGDEDSKPAILAANTTHFVHGNDWTDESLMKQLGTTKEWFNERGIKLLYLPYTESISTSKIINRVVEAQLKLNRHSI